MVVAVRSYLVAAGSASARPRPTPRSPRRSGACIGPGGLTDSAADQNGSPIAANETKAETSWDAPGLDNLTDVSELNPFVCVS
jgi:hypothetical protein